MTGHIHADLMAMYAEDAKTHAEPWKLWEVREKGRNIDWFGIIGPRIAWDVNMEYRRIPRTLTVTVPWFPEPMLEAPEMGSEYFVPYSCGGAIRHKWDGDSTDAKFLSARVCHATREAAEQHSAAILALNKMERGA